jgi:hypothetical protein
MSRAQDAAGLGGETAPGLAGSLGDGVVVGERAVREESLLEIEPHPFHGVELGRVGRQRNQRDVGGCDQVVSLVLAGLI